MAEAGSWRRRPAAADGAAVSAPGARAAPARVEIGLRMLGRMVEVVAYSYLLSGVMLAPVMIVATVMKVRIERRLVPAVIGWGRGRARVRCVCSAARSNHRLSSRSAAGTRLLVVPVRLAQPGVKPLVQLERGRVVRGARGMRRARSGVVEPAAARRSRSARAPAASISGSVNVALVRSARPVGWSVLADLCGSSR